MIIFNLIFIALGIGAVLNGADRMTDGAVILAKRMNLSELVIGLTIVAIGTSAPELFISMMSAIKGTADIAVGNVIGSNIFNTLLITGMTAAITPIAISRTTVKQDLPITFIASIILLFICMDDNISRLEAAFLFILFVGFIIMTIKKSGGKSETASTDDTLKQKKASFAVLNIVFGLALLIIGSQVFVENATKLAASLGVSQAVIGLTIVAGGTSLPELATSIVAAKKGQSAIAIGNIIGSNVFNILLIVGATGLVLPMKIEGITNIDLLTMMGSLCLLWLFSFTKLKVERWEGGVLLLVFIGYMLWLIH